MTRTSRQMVAVLLVAIGAAVPVRCLLGQNGPALIRQGIGAYNDFDPERALPLLRRGVDPKAGPRDSLWALGVQYLAQILYEQGDEAAARAWIHWAIRTERDFELDTLNLLSQVLVEFRSARAAAVGPDDARATTEWIWPASDPGSGPGHLELRSADSVSGFAATVAGVGATAQRLSLAAGSYDIEARAPGYRPARITREVLPGITAVVTFDLQPERSLAAEHLPDEVRERVARAITRLVAVRLGVPWCAAAVPVGQDGLQLTTYQAIRGAERIGLPGVVTASNDASVAGYDVGGDLAVLALGDTRSDSLPVAEAAHGEYAWGFGLRECRAAEPSRIRVRRADGEGGLLLLEGRVAHLVAGSPVIASDGSVLGFATTDTTAVAARAAVNLVAQGRANVGAGVLRTAAAVALAEHHRYGSLRITASSGGAAEVEITPLERWHWPDLARRVSLPFTLLGPEGRYRLVMTAGGRTGYDDAVEVAPGTSRDLVLPPVQVAVKKKGRFPWLIAALGAAGAGTAAALLLRGGDDTGSISIRFPNPP